MQEFCRVRFLGIFGICCMGFISIVGGVSAEDEHFSAGLKSRHIFDTDVNAQPGEIHVTESTFKATYEDKIAQKLPITLSLDYKHVDLQEDVPVELPNHLEGVSFGLSVKFPVPFVQTDQYFLGIDVNPSMFTDDGRWESSAFRMPAKVYLIYKPEDKLIFVAGLSIRMGYDSTVLPILGLIYKPNDKLSFNLASTEPNISYKLDEQTDVFMEFDYIFDEYEVTRAAQMGVVLKNRSMSTGFGMRHEFVKNVDLELSTGAVFNRKISYRDGNGKVEPDAGAYAQAKLSAKF